MQKIPNTLPDFFEQAEQKLRNIWGYQSFRSGQAEAIRSVFEGRDTLVLFPTGGGKSLCYQVPATVFEGLTLVISPLVALMEDQVAALNAKGVRATFINSTIPRYEAEQRLVNARNGMYKLIYCAPERLSTHQFQAELPGLNIDLVAVDEAHCVSEWGHDFRPSYMKIFESLGDSAHDTRWLALTATATPKVKEDILTSLKFEDQNVISRGFARPNLKWWVVPASNKNRKLAESVSKASKKGDGLIYGGTRRNCEQLAETFSRRGLKTEAYHAGVKADKRKAIQQRWIAGETPLVAATNAFGMGIDKPDCRYVIHAEMPYSLEAYYQEAGRAGRDGEESFPILLYRPSDYTKARKRLEDNYPTREELNHAYKVICDSLNLAVGSQMEFSESFDIEAIQKRGKLSFTKARAALRILHQFDIIFLQNDVEPAVKLQFTMNPEILAQFRDSCGNPEKAEFVDKLERIFGHFAFHDMVKVEEEYLLEKLDISRNALIKALNVLMANDHVLVFEMLKERGLIKVLEARSTELPLDKKQVETHRNNLFSKLDYMHGYVQTESCREVYLRTYFGDIGAEPCGHCDNCSRHTSGEPEDYSSYEISKVYEVLAEEGQSLNDLCRITGLKSSTMTEILQYLIREDRINTDPRKPGIYIAESGTATESD